MSHTDTSGCPPHELHTQVEFSNNQPHEGSPETEFRRTPTRRFIRDFFGDRLRFPDGLEAEIWGFEDETSGRGLPSPPIRAREGDIVHVTLKPSKSVHTIHLHGIEPDPRNDGVGHTSFEVTGEYTYQFQAARGVPGNPNEGMAGTYFYHCHVNTVLHVQMGMFGPMIFDPPDGRGKAFIDDPVGYDRRAETLLVPFAVDPDWHDLNHAAGLDGEDVGLNRFRPTNFYALGADLNAPWPSTPVKTVTRIPATVSPDKPGLLRINNGSYFPTVIRFHGGLKAEVISHDGRALRDTSVRPSPPIAVATDFLGFGAAERYDLRLRPPAGARPGDEFPVTIEWRQWVTNEVVGTVTVSVVVIDPGPVEDRAPSPPPDAEPKPAGGPPTAPDSGPQPPASNAPARPIRRPVRKAGKKRVPKTRKKPVRRRRVRKSRAKRQPRRR
jgi:FtsP/CotA-like multicopper oxidase with cupredoxin domain